MRAVRGLSGPARLESAMASLVTSNQSVGVGSLLVHARMSIPRSSLIGFGANSLQFWSAWGRSKMVAMPSARMLRGFAGPVRTSMPIR